MQLLALPTELILTVTDHLKYISYIANLMRTCRFPHNAMKLRLFLENFKKIDSASPLETHSWA